MRAAVQRHQRRAYLERASLVDQRPVDLKVRNLEAASVAAGLGGEAALVEGPGLRTDGLEDSNKHHI